MLTKQHWLTDAQMDALKEFLSSIGVHNYELKFSSAVEDGENFGGVILNVDLLEVKNANVPINHFIIKCSPQSDMVHSAAPFVNVYNLELYVYSTVFPEYVQIQREKDVGEVLQVSPKFYTSLMKHREEMLVLEDVKLRGYVHHNRYLPLNYDHVLIMVKQYAKIHALSYAIRDQKPGLFQEFQKDMSKHFFEDLSYGTLDEYIKHRFTYALQALSRDHDGLFYDKFVYFSENWNTILKSLMSKSRYHVICHVDCGISNVLFKYQHSPKIPTDAVILDWQHSRMDSPAVDIVTFILSSADTSTLEQFDELVVEYYKSLSSFLRELGSDPNEVLPFEVLQSELKTYGIVGLFMTVLLLHVYAAGDQKLPSLVTDESYSDGFVTYDFDDRTHYDSRMRAAICQFHKLGYNFK